MTFLLLRSTLKITIEILVLYFKYVKNYIGSLKLTSEQ